MPAPAVIGLIRFASGGDFSKTVFPMILLPPAALGPHNEVEERFHILLIAVADSGTWER